MQTDLADLMKNRNTTSPVKGTDHLYLTAFTGEWKIEGENAPRKEGAAPEPVVGDELYEWMDGEYFMVNHFDRRSPSSHFKGMGWIGYDQASHSYLSYSISNLGLLRIYQVDIREGEIQYSGEFERGLVKLVNGRNNMSIRWEQTHDEGKTWQMLCDLKGHRVI